jgi:hypothetical protein
MKGQSHNLGEEGLRAITLKSLYPIENLALDLHQIVADERVDSLMTKHAE